MTSQLMNVLTSSRVFEAVSSRPLRLAAAAPERSARWESFQAVIEERGAELHAFAYRMLGGRAEAEDALQNTYMKAFQATGEDSLVLAALPWLYRVLYRCCVDELRRVRRARHDVLDQLEAQAMPPDYAATRALSSALLGLPEQMRAAVLLVDVHGLSYDEAAEVLNVPRGTVASRLNHGRATLRDVLADFRPGTGGRP
jgi:RNA polymerase sigma-70 factor (ECF subfamily)